MDLVANVVMHEYEKNEYVHESFEKMKKTWSEWYVKDLDFINQIENFRKKIEQAKNLNVIEEEEEVKQDLCVGICLKLYGESKCHVCGHEFREEITDEPPPFPDLPETMNVEDEILPMLPPPTPSPPPNSRKRSIYDDRCTKWVFDNFF